MENISTTATFHEGWYSERFKGYGNSIQLKEKLFEKQSQYQNIKVYQTEGLGKMLLLDNKTMISEKDEFVYHEMIVHVPLNVHPNPERVLVIGGGDGGTIREIVKHPEVKEAVLVDIDNEVTETCKKFFPNLTCELNNPKVKIKPQDGIEFIKNHKNYFDVIIIDSTDPEGFAEALFQQEFYQNVYEALKEDGIMSNQTDNPLLSPDVQKETYKNIAKVFPNLFMYTGICLIYPGTYWSWGFASKKYHPLNDLEEAKIKSKKLNTSYYNTDIHKASFALPNFIKKVLPQQCEQAN